MKNIIFVFCFFFFVLAVYPRAIQEETDQNNEKTEVSYAFGIVVGVDLLQTGFEIDYTAFAEGLRSAMEKQQTKIDQDEAIEIVQAAYERLMEKQAVEFEAREIEFLEENSLRPEINITESGLQYEILEEGSGEKPGPDDVVLVHYEGTLIDGTVFDSSYQSEPEEVPLNMVIQGWTEGIQLINTGGKIRLFIPSDLAYGEYGAGSAVPPYSTLIFTVELLDIIKDDEYDEEEFEEDDE